AIRGVIGQTAVGNAGAPDNGQFNPFNLANTYRAFTYFLTPAQLAAAGIQNGSVLTSIAWEVTSGTGTMTDFGVSLANGMIWGSFGLIGGREVFTDPSSVQVYA